MRLLLALRRIGAPFAKRPTDLFRALLVTSEAITKQVDRLAKNKLVRRLPDPDYGGGFLVRLADHGVETVDRVATVIARESFIGPAMAVLKPAERSAAEQFCLALVAALERPAPTAVAEQLRLRKSRRFDASLYLEIFCGRSGGEAMSDADARSRFR